MSWAEPLRAMRIVALAILALAVAGCTVRPLYSDAGTGLGAAPGVAARLSSVSVSEPATREGQEVRNRLIFLLGRGAGEPADPAYRMQLTVSSRVIGAAVVQIGSVAQEPTSSVVTITATYNLVDIASGQTVLRGARSANASYDVPRQQFASLRAQRSAEDRAAREAAELVYHAVAQQLAR